MRRRSPLRTAAGSSVLILGAARSGTTMVASMLGAHTGLGIVTEDLRMVFTRISGKPIVGNKLTIPNQIQFDRRSTRTKQALGLTLQPLIGARRVHGIDRLTPQSRHSIEDYLDLPDLHVVGVLRDHASVALSMIVRARMSPRLAVRRWEAAVHTLERVANDPRFSVAFVEYGGIVSNPEHAARALCDFLGIAFEPGMLEGVRHNPNYPGRVGIALPDAHAVADPLPVPHSDAMSAYQRLLDRCPTWSRET